MRNSRRFINFALFSVLTSFAGLFWSCKGRTAENMEPTGDTIEVVFNAPAVELPDSI
ncbi:MAG: hypothetical protein J1F43_05460 [Muribaculaceae bacterium]|nr:hypothetical protein [Muribaculaceae bacterium]